MGGMRDAPPPHALGHQWTKTGSLPLLPSEQASTSNDEPGLTPGARRVWFWIIEVTLIAVCIDLAVFVRDWWEDGEHITGVVVDVVHEDDTMTIRDPATELEITVHRGVDHRQVGDTATAVVKNGDPTRAMTPADLESHVQLLAGLASLPVLWPLLAGLRRVHHRRSRA